MEDAGGDDEFDAALRDLNVEDEEEEEEGEEGDDSPRARLSALIWQRRPFEEVRSLLVEEHPELIKERFRRRGGSQYRRLPIHEAVVSGCDADLIRYFLGLWPLSARERVDEGEEGTALQSHLRDDEDANEARTETGLCPLQLALISDIVMWGSQTYVQLVKLLVEAWPEALRLWDPKPFLFPLNLALDAAHPCPDVIQYLFEQCPDPLTGDDEFFLVERPLHRKLKRPFGGDPTEQLEVIKFLVAHRPTVLSEKDRFGRLPLHWAAKDTVPAAVTDFLIEQHPDAVREKDNSVGGGLVPLHFGVKYGTTVKHLHILNKAWPESISTRDDGEEGYTPLHRAVDRLDIQWDVVRCLAENSPESLLCRSADTGMLPLHVAITSPFVLQDDRDRRGDPVKLVQYLVEQCPKSVRKRDGLHDDLPLHRAVRGDAPLPLVKFLYHQFPEAVQETDHEGRLPLHLAVARRESEFDVSNFLWNEYPDAARTKDAHGRLPLHAAASTSHDPNSTMLHLLVQLNPFALRERDDDGFLPIHHAASSNRDGGTVVFLVALWPESVQELTGAGWTPLACAAAAGWNASPDTVRFLAERWPEAVGLRDHDGWLPLHCAVCQQHADLDVVRILVGLRPEAVHDRDNAHGMLPLHCATNEGAPMAVVRLFVDLRPESVGERCGDGWLALHYAVSRDAPSLDVAPFLLEQRPESVRETLPDGRTPLHCAVDHKLTRLELARLIVERWPDSVHQEDFDGALPLHSAARVEDQYPDVVEYLVEQWPQATRARDAHGKLPIHLAAAHGARLDVVYILLSSWPECLLAGVG